jgi:hypothetical protein
MKKIIYFIVLILFLAGCSTQITEKPSDVYITRPIKINTYDFDRNLINASVEVIVDNSYFGNIGITPVKYSLIVGKTYTLRFVKSGYITTDIEYTCNKDLDVVLISY